MKNRIEVLDFAKGLAIFLVIMGHATDNLATPLWRLVIYSFHMPLFFLVAGMVVLTSLWFLPALFLARQ